MYWTKARTSEGWNKDARIAEAIVGYVCMFWVVLFGCCGSWLVVCGIYRDGGEEGGECASIWPRVEWDDEDEDELIEAEMEIKKKKR